MGQKQLQRTLDDAYSLAYNSLPDRKVKDAKRSLLHVLALLSAWVDAAEGVVEAAHYSLDSSVGYMERKRRVQAALLTLGQYRKLARRK